MAEKTTRKALLREPDEFITFTGKLIRYGREHEKQVYIACIVFFSLVFAFAGIRFLLVRSEKKAWALYESAQERYVLGQMSGETEKGLEKVEQEMQGVMEDYSRTPAGKLAVLGVARVAALRGQWDAAIKGYEKALSDFSGDPLVESMIHHGMGYALEGKKEYAKAAGQYGLAAQAKESAFRTDALFALGRVYSLMGEKQKSLDAYRQLVKDYPDFPLTRFAEERVNQLS